MTFWLALLLTYRVDRVERGGPILDVEELRASFFLAVFWPVIAAPTFVLGTPIHESLSLFRIRRWITYALAGCVVGFLISAALLALASKFSYEYERQFGPEYHRNKFIGSLPLALIFGGLPGSGAAIAFWATLRPDRP